MGYSYGSDLETFWEGAGQAFQSGEVNYSVMYMLREREEEMERLCAFCAHLPIYDFYSGK